MLNSEEIRQRASYAWALYFFEGTLIGVSLPVLPYVIADTCMTYYENSSDHTVLLIQSGIVATFYSGRMVSSLLINPWKENRRNKYKLYFVITSFIIVPTLILFGYSNDLKWLIFTRFISGILSGYSCSLALNIESKPYNCSAWIIGLALSAFLSGLFYASSEYKSQPINTSMRGLELHPAVIGVSICVFITLLVILRVRIRSRYVDKGSEDTDNSAHNENKDAVDSNWGWGITACNPVYEQAEADAAAAVLEEEALQTSQRRSQGKSAIELQPTVTAKDSSVKHTSSTQPTASLSREHKGNNNNNSVNGYASLMNDGDFSLPLRSGSDATDNLYMESDLTELQVCARYIRGCGGDYEEALKRWRLTLQWRKEFDVDNILNEPQPDFTLIKECYPHFIHGHARTGQPVYFEQLGKIDIKRLQQHDVDVHKLLRYYIFLTEYIWSKVEPDDDHGQLVTILDVDGVGVADVMGDALEFIREAAKLIQSHYVERCKKMFIVRAPFFFNMLWRIISPMLHENTRKKITILGADTSALLEFIDAKQLPVTYGGTGPPLGSSKEEIDFCEFVSQLNAKTSSKSITRDVENGISGSHKGGTSVPVTKLPAHSIDNESTSESVHETAGAGFSTHSHISVRSSLSEAVVASRDRQTENVQSPKRQSRLGLGALVSVFGTVASGAVEGVRRLSAAVMVADDKNQEAHLGLENAYEYDKQAGKWIMKGSSHAMDHVYEDETEKRLVRAIQAAQGLVDESEFDDEEEEIELYSSRAPSVSSIDEAPKLEEGSRHRSLVRSHSSQTTPRKESVHGDLGGATHSLLPTTSPSDYSVEKTDEDNPEQKRKFFALSLLFIVWRGTLVCTMETLCSWLFLSDFYSGFSFAPFETGLTVFLACMFVLIGKLSWQERLDTFIRFPLKALTVCVTVVHLPVVFILFLTPLLEGSLGGGMSRIIVAAIGLVATVGCMMVAVVGSSSVCDLQPGWVIWLYSRVYLAEAFGGVIGILLLTSNPWLPFLCCTVICLGLCVGVVYAPK